MASGGKPPWALRQEQGRRFISSHPEAYPKPSVAVFFRNLYGESKLTANCDVTATWMLAFEHEQNPDFRSEYLTADQQLVFQYLKTCYENNGGFDGIVSGSVQNGLAPDSDVLASSLGMKSADYVNFWGKEPPPVTVDYEAREYKQISDWVQIRYDIPADEPQVRGIPEGSDEDGWIQNAKKYMDTCVYVCYTEVAEWMPEHSGQFPFKTCTIKEADLKIVPMTYNYRRGESEEPYNTVNLIKHNKQGGGGGWGAGSGGWASSSLIF